AYALSGNWDNARVIAAQDVPANQLDGRMDQWMRLASPAKPGEQLAALMGITPAASDPGEPTRLALTTPSAPLAAAVPVERPVGQVAEATPPPPPIGPMAAAPGDAPVAEAPAAPAFTPEAVAPPPPPPVAKPARVVHARLPRATVRRATGNSGAVVQIGAYSNA